VVSPATVPVIGGIVANPQSPQLKRVPDERNLKPAYSQIDALMNLDILYGFAV